MPLVDAAISALTPWYIKWPLRLLGGIRRALGALLGWIGRHPWQAACIALLLLCAWYRHGKAAEHAWGLKQQALAGHWRGLFVAQRHEFRIFKREIIRVGKQRVKDDAANVVRVRNEMTVKIRKVRDDLEKRNDADLAALRQRLRNEGSGGVERVVCGGGASQTELPILSAMHRSEALRPGAAAIVDVRDADICTVNTNRLQGLIAAWDAAARTDVNGNTR